MSGNLADRVRDRKERAAQSSDADGSEVAVKQDAPDARDSVRVLLDSMSTEFESALPRFIPLDHFMRVALTGLKTTPGLAGCNRQSLFAALLECAQTGLLPCTEQAAIVPFGGVATFIPQYQGYIEVFHRTGNVARVELDLKYEADRWEYVKGDNPRFQHWPNLETEDRGRATHAYAFLRYKDGTRSDIVILSRTEAERVRDKYSKGYRKAENNGKKDSPWHTEFDSQWIKTCIRRLAKYVPKSPELRMLLTKDGDADDLSGGSYASPAQYAPSTVPGEVVSREAADEPGAATDSEAEWPDAAQPGGGDA